MYDYFYGAEAEQFSFYRIPKVLFTEERFRSVSAEAKVLYGLLLDRMSLSCKNGWLDKEGRVYIIFTIDEVMTALGCADQKAGKLLHELESKCRLIERKRQGLGKPNLIYVKNFVDNHVDNASGSTAPSPESRFQNRENHDSGAVKITDQESLESRSNNTENMFVSIVRKYTRARKLTPRMLNELVEKIEVYNAEKIDGEWVQRLRIHYNCVGEMNIPNEPALPIPAVTVNTRKGVFVSYTTDDRPAV